MSMKIKTASFSRRDVYPRFFKKNGESSGLFGGVALLSNFHAVAFWKDIDGIDHFRTLFGKGNESAFQSYRDRTYFQIALLGASAITSSLSPLPRAPRVFRERTDASYTLKGIAGVLSDLSECPPIEGVTLAEIVAKHTLRAHRMEDSASGAFPLIVTQIGNTALDLTVEFAYTSPLRGNRLSRSLQRTPGEPLLLEL